MLSCPLLHSGGALGQHSALLPGHYSHPRATATPVRSGGFKLQRSWGSSFHVHPSSALLGRPAVRLGARTSHQHRPLAVTQTLGLEERFGGLLVVDDRKGAGPVGAPQAALETPGIEDARKRVPDVVEGIRLLRQRAGAESGRASCRGGV